MCMISIELNNYLLFLLIPVEKETSANFPHVLLDKRIYLC